MLKTMIPALDQSITLLISALLIGAAVAGVTRILQETEARDLLDRFRFTRAWIACSWCCGVWVTIWFTMLWVCPIAVSFYGRETVVAFAALWVAVRFGRPGGSGGTYTGEGSGYDSRGGS